MDSEGQVLNIGLDNQKERVFGCRLNERVKRLLCQPCNHSNSWYCLVIFMYQILLEENLQKIHIHCQVLDQNNFLKVGEWVNAG